MPQLFAATAPPMEQEAVVEAPLPLPEALETPDTPPAVADSAWTLGVEPLPSLSEAAPHVPPAGSPFFDAPLRQDEGATMGHPPQQVMSVSIAEAWIIPRAAFDAWCVSQGERIWRAKGRVRTPAGFFWLEAVMGATTWTPSAAALPLPADTTLAFVGPDLNAEEIRSSIAALLK